MNLLEKLKAFTRDRSFDERKMLNGVELIKTARAFGLTLDEIGKLCDVSKTQVSNWGNPNQKDLPRISQVEPLRKKIGYGRFKCELEPLSESAIEYRRGISALVISILFVLMLGLFWYVLWKPCSDDWEGCRAFPWYERPFYASYKAKQNLEDFREFMRHKEQNTN